MFIYISNVISIRIYLLHDVGSVNGNTTERLRYGWTRSTLRSCCGTECLFVGPCDLSRRVGVSPKETFQWPAHQESVRADL